MLRFFSKIRYKLAAENKVGKYLRYAVGEILLVVIGILIALQINNWNEKRIQKIQGQSLMLELIDEITEDIITCDWAIENLTENIKTQEAIFKVTDLEKLDPDSLLLIFNYSNVDIKINANTYEKIKNQGITKLSDNSDLNKRINEYFDVEVMVFNRGIEFDWNNSLDRMKYLYEQNTFSFNSSLVQGFEEIPIDESKKNLIEFINQPRTRRMIENSYNDAKYSLDLIERFRKSSIDLLTKIHEELYKSNPEIQRLPDFP